MTCPRCAELEAQLATIQAQLRAKEVCELRLAEFVTRLGYTGELTEQAGEKWKAQLAEARDLLTSSQKIKEIQAIMRKYGFVFHTLLDKPFEERTEAEKWEQLTFSIYTDLAEIEDQARGFLEREGDEHAV